MFGWETVQVEAISLQEEGLCVRVRPVADRAACPVCQQSSAQIHSHYERTLLDLPCCGQRFRLRVQVRRFFCRNEICSRKLFAERLPELMQPYARRTVRHNQSLTTIGLALGGEAGQRTASRLGFGVSADTLLRRVRAIPKEREVSVRVLGVDDFALRRGQRYGTILVDEERHCPVDLLPDRTAETLKQWLQAHPEVEVITRDRAAAYAEGAREGTPQAAQVADRFHLLKNLQEAIERVLKRKSAALRETARALNTPATASPENAMALLENPALCMVETETVREPPRTLRLERYEEVRRLHAHGLSIRGIVRQTGLHRETVRKFLRAESFPERAPRAPRGGIVKPFAEYLKQRWAAGCQNALQLFREIKERGYAGGADAVIRWVRPWRDSASSEEATSRQRATVVVPSPRQATWWLLKSEAERKPEEQAFVQELTRQESTICAAQQLALHFQRIVRERLAAQFDEWRAAVGASTVPELKRFAEGLRADEAAVREACKSEWSNGQVEGQVNRLKLIKRQMFGRAKFDLLRLRVLYAP